PAISPENRHNLQVVNRSGEHLLALINDVLDVARIESGRVSLDRKAFDLPSLFVQVVEMFLPKARDKKLKLAHEPGDPVLRRVVGDEGKIRQILINLIGNAVKFTHEGGVSLRSRTCSRDGRDWLEVEVEDSGQGIPPGDLGRIFAAFEQSEEERVRQGGTGLGLTISREYARLMGGDLTVASEPGRGSCFRLAVPVEQAADSGMPPPRLEYAGDGDGEATRAELSEAELEHDLAGLPRAVRERMLGASRRLDKAGLLALMAPFAESAPGFSERLRTLADGYRFDLIEEIISRKPTGTEPEGERHG
ncbi:MAG TPA: ATP-binding protein, partial [Candidatus Deferrimicrobiaceae bacterium]